MLQPVTPHLLEYGVFSKMLFDRQGLIVATRDGRPVGFVHAGFGPDEEGTRLDCTLGTIHLLMLHSDVADDHRLADDLLAAGEEYLRSSGSTVLYAGGIRPLNAFYLGLYGGSEIPGVLQSDRVFLDALQRNNYRQIDRILIFQTDLLRFRPPVSRAARKIKHATQLIETLDPPLDNWWEACIWGSQQRDCFELVDKVLTKVVARATFWEMQPLSACWGLNTSGLFDLYVEPEWRRNGAATYLLGEALRLMRRHGVANVEAQTMETNEAAIAFYQKMGFTEIDHGIVFRKEGGDGGLGN